MYIRDCLSHIKSISFTYYVMYVHIMKVEIGDTAINIGLRL